MRNLFASFSLFVALCLSACSGKESDPTPTRQPTAPVTPPVTHTVQVRYKFTKRHPIARLTTRARLSVTYGEPTPTDVVQREVFFTEDFDTQLRTVDLPPIKEGKTTLGETAYVRAVLFVAERPLGGNEQDWELYAEVWVDGAIRGSTQYSLTDFRPDAPTNSVPALVRIN